MKNKINIIVQVFLLGLVILSSIFFQEMHLGKLPLHHAIIIGTLLIETSILSHSIKKTVED
ncbi:MAG: hypothetical protein Q4Q17_00005, partial [Tissierellia bacterium]|nr:hypothetical protein [Tissierellia bacterium]